MPDRRRDLLDRRLRPRRRAVGRRDRSRSSSPSGSIVPWARPARRRGRDAGAMRTRATGRTGSTLLAAGLSAEEVVARLTGADDRRDHRQLGVVDAAGGSATFTGSACMEWAGGIGGPCFAAQGNILVSDETVTALAEAFEGSRGRPLAERLVDCLAAAQAAGGDRRGQQSAALLVVEHERRLRRPLRLASSTSGSTTTPPRSRSSRGCYRIHQLLFGKTPADEWLEVDDALAAELRGAARPARVRGRPR